MSDDLYKVLGVNRDADPAEIKKAYRKLARELHPDRNKGNKQAEERFKKVSAAYAVLGDKEKKELYDKYGPDGLRDGFDPEMWKRYSSTGGARSGGPYKYSSSDFGGFSGFQGMEDIFETLFGGRGARRSTGSPSWSRRRMERGADVKSSIKIEMMDAVLGRELQIVVPVEGERKSLKVMIPKGIEEGQSIRLKGQGGEGSPMGDMIIEVSVKDGDEYKRKGMDLEKEERVKITTAFLGGTVEVNTPWGKGKIKVPKRTSAGKKMRIKGHGIRKGELCGDLYVKIEIEMPKDAGEEVERLMEKLKEEGV